MGEHREKLSCIVLASGHSKRFGQDKLLYPMGGSTIAGCTLDAIASDRFAPVFVVTASDAVAQLARERGFTPVFNDDTTDDVAVTIRLGLSRLPQDSKGCLFCVCDQPYLTAGSLRRMADRFWVEPDRMVALGSNGCRGNPVIFPARFFPELAALPPHTPGRAVIEKYPHLITLVQAYDTRELLDIDTTADLLK